MNHYDKQHKKNLTQYERQIGDLMDKTQQQVAQLVALWARDLKEDTPFRWNDYPVANQRMDTILKQLTTDLQQSIENGITQEWALSNQKNDHFTQTAFGEYLQQLPEERRAQYLNTNQDAQEAFKQRKVQGLNLSGRVWNLTKEYKEEVEMALDTAIRDGLPATTLATRLKQYLHNPDALFRRVRNRWGELELSKHARAYHPGRGVYRSAYKNARRTAATEINIAYRTSDYDRWQQMDFVVGIEIEPSPTNHKDYDLCNTLAGKYPKGFKFTGWHPHCRCIATPILKTKQEMQRDTERIMQGKEPEQRSENTVHGVPKKYEQWVEDNQGKIAKTSYVKIPAFLKDNGDWDLELQEWLIDNNLLGENNKGVNRIINRLCKKMESEGVERVKITKVEKERSEKELIRRIGGKDATEGSCASLAFAWTANKQGYDVLDFRGGRSGRLVAEHTRRIVRETGMYISPCELSFDFLEAIEKLNLEVGEEYILVTGAHAAIIRPTGAIVLADKFEYLELQGDSTTNKWQRLDSLRLVSRFHFKDYNGGELCKCSDLAKHPTFLKLMEYINTNQRKQKKGKGGGIK